MSTRPSSIRMESRNLSTERRFCTSTISRTVLRPRTSMSVATLSTRSARRPPATTSAPASARPSARVLPSPDVPPTTTATRPERSNRPGTGVVIECTLIIIDNRVQLRAAPWPGGRIERADVSCYYLRHEDASCLAILFLLVGAAVLAYNPPSDTAGPLTVQMQPPAVGAYGAGGYADLARAGVPFVVPVSLQNAGDRAITGTLRMTVIDGWKVAPAGRAAVPDRTARSFAAGVHAEFPAGDVQRALSHPRVRGVRMGRPEAHRAPSNDCAAAHPGSSRGPSCRWSGSRSRFQRAARWGCGACRFGAKR